MDALAQLLRDASGQILIKRRQIFHEPFDSIVTLPQPLSVFLTRRDGPLMEDSHATSDDGTVRANRFRSASHR